VNVVHACDRRRCVCLISSRSSSNKGVLHPYHTGIDDSCPHFMIEASSARLRGARCMMSIPLLAALAALALYEISYTLPGISGQLWCFVR
jgi:hypothetical protein